MGEWLGLINPESGRIAGLPGSGRSRDNAAGQPIQRLAEAFGPTVRWQVFHPGEVDDPSSTPEAEASSSAFSQVRPSLKAIRSAIAAADGVMVAGGDGTIAAVVPYLDLDRHVLLPLPLGTGNGLARELDITSLPQARRAWERGITRPVDLIQVDYETRGAKGRRWMLSTSGLGYVAEVVILANRETKPRLRPWGPLHGLSYPISALGCVFRMGPFGARIRVDDAPEIHANLTNLVVNNTRFVGAYLAVPASSASDGRLTAFWAQANPFAQLAHELAVLSRTYFFSTGKPVDAESIAVQLDEPMTLMLDGELVDEVCRVQWRIVPQALRCCEAPNG